MHPKTVLITGCSSGIGRASALAFLDEEWEVYATARNPADIETLGERGCDISTLDVTDQGDVDRVVSRIVDEHGRIDCLVNNAGYGQFGPVEDLPAEKVEQQFAVNVYGPHRLIRAVLPQMREQEDGTIVNLSSVAGRIAFPGGGAYCGSKFALEALSDALRTEVDDYGIDVVLVEPGPVDTNFPDRATAEATEEELDRSGAYESFYKTFEDARAVGNGSPFSVTPERVASEVLNAASATKPPARVPVGPVARVATLGRLVPDALRDKAFNLVEKLP